VSRLTFHTDHGDAWLWGGEFHHLRQICMNIAIGVLHLDGLSHETVNQLIGPDHSLKRDYRVNHLRWQSNTEVCLRVGDDFLTWHGNRIDSTSLILNTAIQVGSDPVILAARIAGQGPLHGYMEGMHRRWFAEVIDEGLASGVFRRQVRPPKAGGTLGEPWPCGWDHIRDLLTFHSGTGPVVMSYSVDDTFPNRHIAGWRPPPDADLTPDWAADSPGEWAALSETSKGEWRDGTVSDLWYALPPAKKWQLAMTGLSAAPGRRRLDPLDWETYRFGHGLSMLDLTAEDWEDRLSLAFTRLAAVDHPAGWRLDDNADLQAERVRVPEHCHQQRPPCPCLQHGHGPAAAMQSFSNGPPGDAVPAAPGPHGVQEPVYSVVGSRDRLRCSPVHDQERYQG
jgi:hypothetical protein